MSSPITKVVRFIGPDGATHLGEPIPNSSDAHVLTGDLFSPASLHRTGQRLPISSFLSPIDPVSLPCVGLNYRDHAHEAHMDLPKKPMIFYKSIASTLSHLSPIIIPRCCQSKAEVDWEAELVVVIGRPCKNVSEAEALSYVLGYCNGNDVSARDEQLLKERSNGQFCRAKSFDTFAPLGPHLVLAEAVPDPQVLPISLTVNGKAMQTSNTEQMVFSVAQIIAFLSEAATLLPGTAIFTGTPAGVGMGMKPDKIFLKPGDVVEVTIGDLGTLRNEVQNE